ncbi:phage antirepressor KilAC domain-containing protein [Caulobacter sp. 602-1]|uniref:phage antirepressor KilAC domain-containing protein n=1 Tax=Caulobacter sp. 602-1 TaxID=2492472 RepID=UPI000F633F97|nr:phage antirepressor KilAC domain-containing protein [Caulobacter sp. 602-1]RRN64671.1 DNA-binding protein [Caulobacter sp. 602-1]
MQQQQDHAPTAPAIGAAAEPTMSSREIADLVESRHDSVKRTVERLVERGVIVQPPMVDEPDTDAMGRSRSTQVYRLCKRDSYIVVAQLSPEFTARLVDRWEELERQVRQPVQETPEALAFRAMQVMYATMEQQKAQLLEAMPKVAFADSVTEAPDAISLAQAAKILDTGRNRLCAVLRKEGWITRTNEPYQRRITEGLMDVKIGSWEHPEKGLQRSVTALVTGKGLQRLRAMLDHGTIQ